MSFPFQPPQPDNQAFAWAHRRPGAPAPFWAGGPQVTEDKSVLLKAGLVTGGIVGAGFVPIGGGLKIWDKYLRALKHIEELSPARIFRTFQYSEFLSPLGTHKAYGIGPEYFAREFILPSGQPTKVPIESMREFVARMTGTSTAKHAAAYEAGFQFRRTGVFFGEVAGPGGVITKAALPMKVGTAVGGSFLDWYARVSGVELGMTKGVLGQDLGGTLFVTAPKVDRFLGIPLTEHAAVRLQKARVMGRYMRAYWAGQIGRLNRLLQTTVDLPVVGKYLTKLGEKLNIRLTVGAGTATQMLGRYAAKGLMVAGAYKAIQGLSHWRSKAEGRVLPIAMGAGIGGAALGLMTRSKGGAVVGAAVGGVIGGAPIFDQGIIEGFATMIKRAHIGYARHVSEPLGFTEAAAEQERFMPGISKLKTFGGLAVSGLLGGFVTQGIGRYTSLGMLRDYEAYDYKIKEWKSILRTEVKEASGISGRTRSYLWPKALKGKMAHRLALTGGRLGLAFGVAAGLGFMAAGAIATGSAPGILGAEKTAAEMEEIYAGRQEVPIRKGRWWEFGRCLTKSNTYKLLNGEIKTTEEIEVDDVLIGRDYRPAKVLNIWKRHHKGNVYRVFSAFDRDIATEVTDNHIIPILRDNKIIEIEARKIALNDWVEIPFSCLQNTLDTIKVAEIIKEPIIILDDRIYSAQRNWHNKKWQQSGTKSISTQLTLDYDLGLLFGYFLAEGNIGFKLGKANVIETVHARSEYEYVTDIKRIVYEKFGDQITERFKTTGKKTKEGCWIVRICNGIIAKLFRYLFYPEEYRASDKKIPTLFLEANNDFKQGLLEGYWRGDGHLDGGTRVITSARKNLLQVCQKIALSLGKPCGISRHSKDNKDGFNSWRLRFVSQNATNAPLKLIRNRLYARVRALEIIEYNDLVYDFEVDDKDHLFTVGTFLVHNSSWEGGRVSYYRPNWYALLMSQARIKGLHGSAEKAWQADPWAHPIKALTDDDFQYQWERENYYERPYPITGTMGEEVPFLGPLTGAIGRLIKPPRLMHTDEWLQGGQIEPTLGKIPTGAMVRHVPNAAAHEAAPELGGIARGVPVSPYDTDQELGRMIYNINELRGLTGFMHGAIKEHLTGSQDYFDRLEQLETSRRAYGDERWYWDKELGGLLGSTEAFRRFLPHRRRQIQLYNPIRNLMPEWLPGPDYYVDFRHGDPYTKVQEGELRLPGRGYAALHPEVAGLAPADYPLFHKYKILADVAMYSDEFKAVRSEVESARKKGFLSNAQLAQVHTINKQLSEKKRRKRFTEYQFSTEALEKMRVQVKEQISPGMFSTENSGVIKLSGIRMAHDAIAEANQEVMASEDSRVKRAQISDFLREYIQPGMELDVYVHKDTLHRYATDDELGAYQPAAIESGGVNLGDELVDRGLAEYMDNSVFARQAKYTSGQRILGSLWEDIAHYESPIEYLQPISPVAKFLHQRSAVEEYERSRVYGTDAAFWQHPVKHFIKPAIWMAREQMGTSEIPEHVQKRWEIEGYFDKLKYLKYQMLESAARTAGLEEDAKAFRLQQRRTLFGVNPYGPMANIYSALPTLERDYFQEFADADSMKERARIMKLIPPDERPIYEAQWTNREAHALRAQRDMGTAGENVSEALSAMHLKRMTEGRPVSQEQMQQYEKQGQVEESYADWSRQQELEQYFDTHPLPGPDWVGWHPHADLEDVKLKLVDTLGEDIHDYNLWESRQRTLARKPYLDEDSMSEVMQEPEENPQEVIERIKEMLRDMLGLENVYVTATQSGQADSKIEFELTDSRLDALNTFKGNPEFFEMV